MTQGTSNREKSSAIFCQWRNAACNHGISFLIVSSYFCWSQLIGPPHMLILLNRMSRDRTTHCTKLCLVKTAQELGPTRQARTGVVGRTVNGNAYERIQRTRDRGRRGGQVCRGGSGGMLPLLSASMECKLLRRPIAITYDG